MLDLLRNYHRVKKLLISYECKTTDPCMSDVVFLYLQYFLFLTACGPVLRLGLSGICWGFKLEECAADR